MLTDLALAAEQAAMQAMYNFQTDAQDAPGQDTALPPMHLYSSLPREWPLARMCISYKQVNKYVRIAIWRRVAELGLRGTHFKGFPELVHTELVGDLLILCNALAVPLSNLFSFLCRGHPQCTFVDQAHLALYADLHFWQCGLLAFCSMSNPGWFQIGFCSTYPSPNLAGSGISKFD